MSSLALLLPSGIEVTMRASISGLPSVRPRARALDAPLFSELPFLIREGTVILDRDLAKLELRDFHTLRAIATRLGWIAEETLEWTCKNCRKPMKAAPCAALPLGPFVDHELGDPELDRTLDLSRPHPIPDTRVRTPSGRRQVAREITLGAVTLEQAAPLHRALGRAGRGLSVTPPIVRAMGIVTLGDVRDPRRLAEALANAPERAWDAVTDLFLDAHYPPRLFAPHACPACGARNDVDAPYDREFDRSRVEVEPASSELRPGLARPSNAETFPTFQRFDARAHVLARQAFGDHGDSLQLVIDGGVPACDDGGEPLLGSYVPVFEGDMQSPSHPPQITVYYRTFRAIWDEEGPFDWEAELSETLEHELEHHQAYLAGDDPMDREERGEIEREARRVFGEKELVRGGVRALGADVGSFLARTWPIWLILAVASFILLVFGR